MFAVLGPATIAASMAIDRPEATDAAPVCGPQRSGGCQPGEFLASRGMGGPGSPRDLSRGVVPQGKKVAGRHCGIGGRGEAVLRSDPAIEEAIWGRRDLTATYQGRTWRTPATECVRHVWANGPLFRPVTPSACGHLSAAERQRPRQLRLVGNARAKPARPLVAPTVPRSRSCLGYSRLCPIINLNRRGLVGSDVIHPASDRRWVPAAFSP